MRAASRIALAKTGHAEALPLLVDGLRDGSQRARRATILSLGILGLPSCLDALREIIVDDDWEARERAFAAVALGLVDGREEPNISVAAYDGETGLLSTGLTDGTTRVFDTATGAELFRVASPARATAFAWLDETLLVGDETGGVTSLDVDHPDDAERAVIHESAVRALALDPRGRKFLSATRGGSVAVVDLRPHEAGGGAPAG